MAQRSVKFIPKILLAKSVKSSKTKASLLTHTVLVMEAASVIFDHIKEDLKARFRTDLASLEVRNALLLAAFLHDLGKANDHFQAMIRWFGRRNPQIVRHEVVSILIGLRLRPWIEDVSPYFWEALVAAGGHHLKLGQEDIIASPNDLTRHDDKVYRDRIFLYTKHNQFRRLLDHAQKVFGLEIPHGGLPESLGRRELENILQEALLELGQQELNISLLVILKPLVMAADALASAGGSNKVHFLRWVKENLPTAIKPDDLEEIIRQRLDGNGLRVFQQELGRASGKRVTVAVAGCGTGKTIGAYNWAWSHVKDGTIKKLFVCYPTTGTSTEGFLDYAAKDPKGILEHGRAEIDLAGLDRIQDNGEDENLDNEAEAKLAAFKSWAAKFIVCTVDSVLGLVQCQRKAMYRFPAIAQAGFVFDEVHCFDERLFGALIEFIGRVQAPILLMSASFSKSQLAAIKEASGEIELIQGPKDIESQKRYRIHAGQQPPWLRVEEAYKQGGKILWVCNQVQTAIDACLEAEKRGLKPIIYHSRFCYADRVDRHKDLIEAFRKEGPVLAITTQVAEMSLDISATLLVSQLAPIASLIQRLGRLNRLYCGVPLSAFIYPDPSIGYPYSKEDLQAGAQMIGTLEGKDVSQRMLAKLLDKIQADEKPIDPIKTALFHGEWRTYSKPLREGGTTVSAILEEHLALVEKLPNADLPKFLLPLPSKGSTHWKRHRRIYPVAPHDVWVYSKKLGAQPRKQEGRPA